MLNVQKYLQENSLEDLENEFGIKVSYYNDRVVLNYSQIDSPKFHPICDECRGLILSYPKLEIICRSFNRFYNYGEGGEFSIDKFNIKNSVTFQKIDGSLINIYLDHTRNWHCATRKMAFAEGSTNKNNTFKSVVEKSLGYKIEKLKCLLDINCKDYTFICEVVSPETRVVVPYKNYEMYLLSIRNKVTGEYLSHNKTLYFAELLKMKRPKKYLFDSFENIIESSKELEPMSEEGEGYICYDYKTQNRIKIKNPSYLAIANLRMNGAISNKRISLLVFDNDYDEYLNYFPEDKQFFDPYIEAYENMLNNILETWHEVKYIKDQKEFALKVKDLPISGILFSLRKDFTLSDIFDRLTDNSKEKLLNQYVEK